METVDVDRIRDALFCVPAHDRNTWLRMGMAVKSVLGEEGFPIWDDWSRQVESYNVPDAKSAWRSIKPVGRITVASLFHEARTNGWRDDCRAEVPEAKVIAQRRRDREQHASDDQLLLKKIRQRTAAKAKALLEASKAANPDHPYLARKRIGPLPSLREISADEATKILGYAPSADGQVLTGRLLLVPITVDECISTLEMIDGAGRKAALAGRGTRAGGYWATSDISGPDDTAILLIGEGVATAISAQMASRHLAMAAFSNSNLTSVALAMRERHPSATIVILCDLVKATGTPDPRAIEAARACKGRLAIPTFPEARPAYAKDFNDMANLLGSSAVVNAIANACEPRDEVPPFASPSPLFKKSRATVALVRAADIKPEPIDWVWEDYIAAGKLALLAGAPGTGKTTIAMKIAATITTGDLWPDGSRACVGSVVIWSGEDDPRDTLVPRLIIAGADLSRVRFVTSVHADDEARPFDPSRDTSALRTALAEVAELRLLIVDPIVSAVAGDSHKNAEVRRSLQPLVDLATDYRSALLGITHFSKGTAGRDPVERLNGSLAFGALARIVMVATKQQDQEELAEKPRLLVRAKSNIGPDGGGFEYTFQFSALASHPDIATSMVRWGRPVVGGAREILARTETPPSSAGQTERADAKQFLLDALANGPVDSAAIIAEAKGAGHALATLRRAAKELAIKPRKVGMKRGWAWELPRTCSLDTEHAQTVDVSTFETCERLRNGSAHNGK